MPVIFVFILIYILLQRLIFALICFWIKEFRQDLKKQFRDSKGDKNVTGAVVTQTTLDNVVRIVLFI